MNMTVTQKLNRVLEFLVSEPTKINTNSHFIKKYVFNDSITLDEAQLLIKKLLESDIVRKMGGKYPAYSIDTQLFLDEGGFGGEYSKVGKNQDSVNADPILETEIKPAEVFVSYAWGDTEHEMQVLEFTDFLRKKGFHAEMDKMISQRESTINFKKMMFQAMQYQKVIVVLSKNYKLKADSFHGGVGTEFQLLINDIEDAPTKYILVSFNGFSDEIIPFGLKGYEIVDLSNEAGVKKLYRKLMDEDRFIFSPVSPEKPNLESESIGDFKSTLPSSLISIEEPSVKIDGSSSQGGQYSKIEYKVSFNFKNISGKTLDGFAYECKISYQLTPQYYGQSSNDGYHLIDETISQKVFPNKTIKGTEIDITINSHAKHQVLESVILITVFTDYGDHSKEYKISELLKARPASESWGEPQSLKLEMFK